MSRSVGTAIGALLILLFMGTLPVLADDDEREGRDHRNHHRRGARAPAAGMTLYEVTESVRFDRIEGIEGPAVCTTPLACRWAKATLLGFAKLGTPLCPVKALLTNPNAETCTILGTGFDSVSLATGVGPVRAELEVVVNAPGNSPVHVPDLGYDPLSGRFLWTAEFQGTINLSQAVISGVPLGVISSGSIVLKEGGTTVPISATFRLPFALDRKGYPKEIDDEEDEAFYLADNGSLIRVQPHERNLGFPTVRVEVNFLPQ